MASTVSVTVPPDQGDAVIDTLLTLYQAKAEALRLAVLAYLDDRRCLDEVLEHRDEMAEIDALLDLTGWNFGARDRVVELVGPPALVREVVHATLAAAADVLARNVERYERAEIELDALTSAAHAVAVLLETFVTLEGAAS